MAKPKLSKKRKAQLKKELSAEKAKGTPVPQIVKTYSKKYKLSGHSIRYYLNADGAAAKAKKKAGKKRKAKAASFAPGDGKILLDAKEGQVVLRTKTAQLPVASVIYSDEKKLLSALRKSVQKMATAPM